MIKRMWVLVLACAAFSALAGEKQCLEIVVTAPAEDAKLESSDKAIISWHCEHKKKPCKQVYAVEVMKRRDGKVCFSAENLKTNAVEITGLDSGEEYTWAIWCGKNIRGGRFYTAGKSAADKKTKPTNADGLPKWQEVKGVNNMRDIGGWKGLNGKRVKLGRIYRSAALEKVTPEGLETAVNKLGIKTDLDLRTPEVVKPLNGISPLKIKYSNQSSDCYGGFGKPKGMKNFAETFRWFLNDAEYPVLFHCAKGADRTGSWAFFLNGLLGVSEADLRCDWELTQNWNSNPLFKHRTRYNSLVKVVEKYEGATFTEKVVAWAKACGITEEEISKWRSMMLE